MRKRRATKRDVLADPIYNSKVVTKLVNHIMKDGKKGTAQNIIYDAFDIVKEKTGEEAMVVLNLLLKLNQEELVELTTKYQLKLNLIELKL